MATQETKTQDAKTQQTKTADQNQSQQKSASQQAQPQQGQTQQTMSRDTQLSGRAARSGYNPLGLSLMPTDLLSLSPFGLLNPFSLLRRITEETDRPYSQSGSRPASRSDTAWLPPIELSEGDDNVVIVAELPGQGLENIRVEVTDDAVIIEGERAMGEEEDRGDVYRTECRYGRFYRSIPLPEGANAENATASYDNGVLEVIIPVATQSGRRQLPIEA
jgi:HSP20 family protein